MSFLLDNKKIELDYMSDISSNITCIIEEMELTKLSKTELLEKCQENGIKKYKSKNKEELINLLQNKPVDKKNVKLIIEEDVEHINEPIIASTPQNTIDIKNITGIEYLKTIGNSSIDLIFCI